MTLHPSRKSVSLDELERSYQAPFIRDAIARYIAEFNHPNYSAKRIEQIAENMDSPVTHLPVYHKVKLWLGSKQHHRLMANEFDTIHARPTRSNKHNHSMPGRFDTVLVNTGNGQYVGLDGESIQLLINFLLIIM